MIKLNQKFRLEHDPWKWPENVLGDEVNAYHNSNSEKIKTQSSSWSSTLFYLGLFLFYLSSTYIWGNKFFSFLENAWRLSQNIYAAVKPLKRWDVQVRWETRGGHATSSSPIINNALTFIKYSFGPLHNMRLYLISDV